MPLVLAGAGVAVVPRPMAAVAERQGAVVASLRPALRRQLGLIHRDAPLSPAARAFIDLARIPLTRGHTPAGNPTLPPSAGRRRSVQVDGAVLGQHPVRVVGHLPGVPVRIEEETGVATPTRWLRRPGRAVPPAASASASTTSTASGEATLWARVTPPHPPPSVTTLSAASSDRLHRARIIPPAWKK